MFINNRNQNLVFLILLFVALSVSCTIQKHNNSKSPTKLVKNTSERIPIPSIPGLYSFSYSFTQPIKEQYRLQFSYICYLI